MDAVKKEKKTYWVVTLTSHDMRGIWRETMAHLYRSKEAARAAGCREVGKNNVISFSVSEV